MTAVKRRLCSMDDEPFDSFKRRHIQQVKSDTASAAPQSSPGYKNEVLNSKPQGCSKSTFESKKSRTRSLNSKFGWKERLQDAFGTKHPHESETENRSMSASHRQLEMKISDTIGSPVLPSMTINSKAKSIAEEPLASNRGKLRIVASRNELSSQKPKRIPQYIHQRRLWKELIELEEIGKRLPPQDDKERPPYLHFISKNGTDESGKRSGMKPPRLVPLSNLLISAKEYHDLSLLTPVALEREERYNWGHIKKNAHFRNKIMRNKTRVLQMSSQAPVPSANALGRRFRTSRQSGKPRTQNRPSRNHERGARLKFTMSKHSSPKRPVKPASSTSIRPSKKETVLRDDCPCLFMPGPRPITRKYFLPPANDRSSPVNSSRRISRDPLSTLPRVEGNVERTIPDQGLAQLDQAIREKIHDVISPYPIECDPISPRPMPDPQLEKKQQKKIRFANSFESDCRNPDPLERNRILSIRRPDGLKEANRKQNTPARLDSNADATNAIRAEQREEDQRSSNHGHIDYRREFSNLHNVPVVSSRKSVEKENDLQESRPTCPKSSFPKVESLKQNAEAELIQFLAKLDSKEEMETRSNLAHLLVTPGPTEKNLDLSIHEIGPKTVALNADVKASKLYPGESETVLAPETPPSSENERVGWRNPTPGGFDLSGVGDPGSRSSHVFATSTSGLNSHSSSSSFHPLASGNTNSDKSPRECPDCPAGEPIVKNVVGLGSVEHETSHGDSSEESWNGFPCLKESEHSSIFSYDTSSGQSSGSSEGHSLESLNERTHAVEPPCSQVRLKPGKKKTPPANEGIQANKILVECRPFPNPCRRKRIDFFPSYFSTRPRPLPLNDT
ncbi:hypothetical protein PCANC_22251 [Puccinia coronata f. sp. avenae]|uniref:Uncharacterized protein n=1 Tax=Puccinia coronata f. sp. avenae TaxID=200324 RepID=A0A2N5SF32_9BASI|nr:hypothetical protein PCANC_22251 [Puccinia coronata f. sp. avenae]